MAGDNYKDILAAEKQTIGKLEPEAQVLQAAARGWRLFPVRARDKKPLVKGWPELATTDNSKLSEWFRKYPKCNWGLATGLRTGILVLDADSDAALAQLKKFGQMPRTFTVKTARGRHFYFQYPPDSVIHNSASKLADGLDVRGEGGYVLLPPSVHPTGAMYEALDECNPAPIPTWLLKRLGGTQAGKSSSVTKSEPTNRNRKITEPGRNSELFSMVGSMQRKGWTRAAIEAAVQKENDLRCDPPLDVSEIQKIMKSIVMYEPAEGEGKPIQLILGEQPFAQMVPNAELILRGREEERIFQTPFSRRLVRIVQYKHDPHPDKSVRRDPEASLMTDVDSKYLQLALGRSAQIVKMRKEIPTPIDGPHLLAYMMLSSVTTSPEMTSWRRLKKISCTPILLPNTNMVTEPGYHSESEIWIDTRGINFIDVASGKPRLSARECKKLIEENIYPFLCMYPFLKDAAGQYWHETGAFAVVLSAMMCIDDRHNLSAVPMHCVSAPTQSCGKTRLVQAICAAVTGTMPTIMTYDSVEEFAKHIPVLLGKGDCAICVDNIIMPVNNAKLAALLTQEYAFNYRPLGASADVTIENVSVLFATGVNLQLSGDMPTRCLMVRIEPEDERPEKRIFPFDQIVLAKDLFPRAVMTIKAVLRAHQLAGFPGEKLLKGGSRFSAWDRRVRSAIVWAGFADPIITQEAIRADDPVRNENLRVLWMLREKFREERFLTCDLSSRLTKESLEILKQITGDKEAEAFSERKVGKYFSHNLVGRWFEGIRLIKTGRNPGGRIEWQIEAKLDAASFGVEEPL